LALVTPVANRVALFQLNRGNRRAEGGVAGAGALQLTRPIVSPTTQVWLRQRAYVSALVREVAARTKGRRTEGAAGT